MTDFGKLLTASITPFDSNGVINTDTFWRLCRKLVHDKSDGLVLTGTTGESPNLTIKDREIIYTTALDSVGDKASIVAGTGTYSTSENYRNYKNGRFNRCSWNNDCYSLLFETVTTRNSQTF